MPYHRFGNSKFQHTAARRRLDPDMRGSATEPMFQHTAARRRLVLLHTLYFDLRSVSTHSRPKAAGKVLYHYVLNESVSTHSRPKAAGPIASPQACNHGRFQHTAARRRLGNRRRRYVGRCCFNTQPPEGGWRLERKQADDLSSFNTQPPEGGWVTHWAVTAEANMFQHTAARRRLARQRYKIQSYE